MGMLTGNVMAIVMFKKETIRQGLRKPALQSQSDETTAEDGCSTTADKLVTS